MLYRLSYSRVGFHSTRRPMGLGPLRKRREPGTQCRSPATVSGALEQGEGGGAEVFLGDGVKWRGGWEGASR